MFAGLLIQFHIHGVLLHLGTDSEIKQIPNVAIVSIQLYPTIILIKTN